MARPAQITQNSKSVRSLQYLKKEVRDKVDFLCNEHHLLWFWPGKPKVLKITSM